MSRVSLTPKAGTEATEVIVGLDHACGFFIQVYNAAGGVTITLPEGDPEFYEGPFVDLDTGGPFANTTRDGILLAIATWAADDGKSKSACLRIAGDLDPASP